MPDPITDGGLSFGAFSNRRHAHRHVRVTPVIPLKADIHQRGLHVRLGPKADIQPDQASRDEVTTAEQKPRQHRPRSPR